MFRRGEQGLGIQCSSLHARHGKGSRCVISLCRGGGFCRFGFLCGRYHKSDGCLELTLASTFCPTATNTVTLCICDLFRRTYSSHRKPENTLTHPQASAPITLNALISQSSAARVVRLFNRYWQPCSWFILSDRREPNRAWSPEL